MTERLTSWNDEVTFNDVLYDWMDRAPWVAISAATHLMVFLILTAIPWSLINRNEVTSVTANIEPITKPQFVDPPPEPKPEVAPDEPTLMDDIVPTETTELPPDDIAEVFDGEPSDDELFNDDPFNDVAFNNLIGIGGGAGGSMGRRGDGTGGSGGGGVPGQANVSAALAWLAAHQSPEGYWDADGFTDQCGHVGGGTCDGVGEPLHDVGLTGLALLAFLGRGNTTTRGEHRDVVVSGARWLLGQQDHDTGLIGDRIGTSYLYDHALAALALCEIHYFSDAPIWRSAAQDAVAYITRSRNPYSAWRYDSPPIGDNDTSVTGWMVFVLKSAQESGLKVDRESFTGALSWFDEVTDPVTGRTGYVDLGGQSARTSVNEHYPTDAGETMTAVSLLCRIFMGQDPKEEPLLEKQADLLRQKLPEWDPDGFGCDMYYWYYGTYAMYQMGGKHWRAWNKAMQRAVIDTQRNDGDFAGSWDPVGPWGYSGGRVYSTALMTLCLEVYYRYANVVGAR